VTKQELKVGDKVRINGYPFKEHTGVLLRKTKLCHIVPIWVVELDQLKFGGGIAKCSPNSLTLLTPKAEITFGDLYVEA
jgi:hypothetical protein